MLEEHEWEQVFPVHPLHGRGALAKYFEITGFRETNFKTLWHHRLSLYGPECRVCGKLLRTPRAQWCAACGAFR